MLCIFDDDLNSCVVTTFKVMLRAQLLPSTACSCTLAQLDALHADFSVSQDVCLKSLINVRVNLP